MLSLKEGSPSTNDLTGTPALSEAPLSNLLTSPALLPPKSFYHSRDEWISYPYRWWLSFQYLLILTLCVVVIEYFTPWKKDLNSVPLYDCTYRGRISFESLDSPMTFAQAKGIDLVWNTFVGRGLQLLLSYATCRIIICALMRVTEQYHISYQLFTDVAFSTTNISTIWALSKSFLRYYLCGSKLIFFTLFVSIIYLAVLPTLIDGCSGYQAMQRTMLTLPNSTTVDVSNGFMDIVIFPNAFPRHEPPSYDILKGTPLYNVSFAQALSDPIYPASTYWRKAWCKAWSPLSTQHSSQENFILFWIWFSSDILFSHCIDATTAALTLGVNDTIANYVLNEGMQVNMTVIATYEDVLCDTWHFIGISPNISDSGIHPLSLTWDHNLISTDRDWALASSGVMPNYTRLQDPSTYNCDILDTYQWASIPSNMKHHPGLLSLQGFSYAWILLTTNLTLFWLWILLFIWTSESRSHLVQKKQKFDKWRAILGIAESLNADLGLITVRIRNLN